MKTSRCFSKGLFSALCCDANPFEAAMLVIVNVFTLIQFLNASFRNPTMSTNWCNPIKSVKLCQSKALNIRNFQTRCRDFASCDTRKATRFPLSPFTLPQCLTPSHLINNHHLKEDGSRQRPAPVGVIISLKAQCQLRKTGAC
jgi:hypothetical protein